MVGGGHSHNSLERVLVVGIEEIDQHINQRTDSKENEDDPNDSAMRFKPSSRTLIKHRSVKHSCNILVHARLLCKMNS